MLRFCPHCGSPSVEFSELAGGEGNCKACGWGGSVDDMPVMPTANVQKDVFDRMVADLKNGMAKSVGTFFITFLVKWGFLEFDIKNPTSMNRTHLVRYFTSIARAIMKAVIEERSAIEKEEIQKQQERYGV